MSYSFVVVIIITIIISSSSSSSSNNNNSSSSRTTTITAIDASVLLFFTRAVLFMDESSEQKREPCLSACFSERGRTSTALSRVGLLGGTDRLREVTKEREECPSPTTPSAETTSVASSVLSWDSAEQLRERGEDSNDVEVDIFEGDKDELERKADKQNASCVNGGDDFQTDKIQAVGGKEEDRREQEVRQGENGGRGGGRGAGGRAEEGEEEEERQQQHHYHHHCQQRQQQTQIQQEGREERKDKSDEQVEKSCHKADVEQHHNEQEQEEQEGTDTNYSREDASAAFALLWAASQRKALPALCWLDKASDLHLACRHGEHATVQLLLQRGADVQAKDSWGWTPLHCAVEGGHVSTVQALLQAQASVVARTPRDRWSPFLLACRWGHAHLLPLLVTTGAYINQMDTSGLSPLHHAAREGHLAVVSWLLEQGAKVSPKTRDLVTPLHLAADPAVADLLLFHGAALEARTYGRNMTPLLSACQRGNLHLFRSLQSAGAKVRAIATGGLSAMHFACSSGSVDLVRALLEAGLSADPMSRHYARPVEYAALHGHTELVSFIRQNVAGMGTHTHTTHTARTTDTIQNAHEEHSLPTVLCCPAHAKSAGTLLKLGFSLDVKDMDHGRTLLHSASSQGDQRCVTELLRHGSSPLVTDLQAYTPLHSACANGHWDVAEALIRHGAEVNAYTESFLEKMTPLHLACKEGHTQCVQVLLNHGAQVNNASCRKTPLYFACKHNHPQVVHALMSEGAQVDTYVLNSMPLPGKLNDAYASMVTHFSLSEGRQVKAIRTCMHNYFKKNRLDIVKLLLRNNPLVEVGRGEVTTVLHLACRENQDEEYLDALLKCGVDPDVKDSCQSSALHVACELGQRESIRVLLARGASLEAHDSAGDTPLHRACRSGYAGSAYALLAGGAEPESVDERARTPLHVACAEGKTDVVEVLLAAGAKVNAEDKDKATPLFLACRHDHKDLLPLLEQAGANLGQPDRWGVTPLQLACVQGLLGVLQTLFLLGAHLLDHTAGNALLERSQAQVLEDSSQPSAVDSNYSRRMASSRLQSIETRAALPSYHSLMSADSRATSQSRGDLPSYESLENLDRVTSSGASSPCRSPAGRRDLSPAGSHTLHGRPGSRADRSGLQDSPGEQPAAENSLEERLARMLSTALTMGHTRCARFLLEQSAKPSTRDEEGRSMLHRAAMDGRVDIVQFLLSEGTTHSGDVTGEDESPCPGTGLQDRDHLGRTPLHTAASEGQWQVMEVMVQHGANLEVSVCVCVCV